MTKRSCLHLAAIVAALSFAPASSTPLGGQAPSGREAAVDRVFAKWTSSTPGCAVGVAVGGKPVLARAYGMADLERDVANTTETIFEAGSVSKQFTAAAVLLLVRDGKLSLDDAVRTYVPELPDYGAPLTIRHMLTHTSGLRDWGSVESIAGWPRTTREYTHAHVLDIVSRQRALNFPSGTRWSYSNTGFNLAAIIVSRVSGMPFADFASQRIFTPLGMTRTSWRDDHTRIVKGRAIAYADEKDGLHIQMPFENVHGNGGLLTTVGDLLTWNEHFASPAPGDAAWAEAQQEIARFSDGRQLNYAFGLYVSGYKGVKNVWHSGSTAGYRAHLNRFPDAHTSVAVLCNVTSGDATRAANEVSDVYLADRLTPPQAPSAAHALTPAEADALVGLYRNSSTGLSITVAREPDGGLRLERGAALVALSAMRFVTAFDQTWEFDGTGGARSTDAFGRTDSYQRVPPASPAAAQLQELVGAYRSDEAETTLTAEVDATGLVLRRRPDTTMPLTPIYADAFRGSIGTVIFRRDAAGRVIALSVVQDRVWDLRFTRAPSQE
jgi:CubicO group peptidase (beta-lactamase class C family)